MKWIIGLIAAGVLSGCASKLQFQAALNEVDSHWEEGNKRLIAQDGYRTCFSDRKKCFDASVSSLKALGFEVIGAYEVTGKISGMASAPKPFTNEEWLEIRKVEEPMMQAMAAPHVGTLTSRMLALSSDKSWVFIYVDISSDANNPRVKVNFTTKHKNPTPGLVMGNHPPSEAVRQGLKKWWSTFDAELKKGEAQ